MTSPNPTVITADAFQFSELFYQGQFKVPWHQRYYDWHPGHVRALLQDLDEGIKEDRDCYFLGAIMLVETGGRLWEINDGQQRMITVSLICAALCGRFAREAKGSQREGIALRMLFDLDANSAWTMEDAEHYTPRISPPWNDDMRYRQMIRGNTIGTNGTLTAAWKEIENFFSPMDLAKAEQYFDFLSNRLEVACLWVPPRIDPNAVYETINCRGKQLDDLDLIRNFLYSYFNSPSESQRRISVHDCLERVRRIFPNLRKASEYMRCHLQCRFGFLRKEQFYRDVREAVRAQKDKKTGPTVAPTDYAFELTQQITSGESLGLFQTITAPTPDPEFIRSFEVASGTTNARRTLATFLRELQEYSIALPLIFSTLSWYIRESDGRKKKRVARVANKNLGRLATFVLRTAFVAPKFESSHFETEFSNFAKDISCASDIPDVEFADFLRGCDRSAYGVLDDTKFQDAMVGATMKGEKKIRNFLLGINSAIQQDTQLLNTRFSTVEHILPISREHWGGWTGFTNEDKENWAHRIGNMTLMGPADNKPGRKFNGNFATKRDIYRGSGVVLTRDLSTYTDWTPTAIEERQRHMAEKAVSVWRFA